MVNKKKKNCRTGITNLPEEIISEILSWLPPKSLLQFRSVCKLWPILISNPNFIKLHLNRSSHLDSPNLLLCCSRNNKITHFYEMECNSLGQANQIGVCKGESQLIGTCNGLVCFKNGFRNLCLLNPCTREYKDIFIAKLFQLYEYCVFGLGYDSVNDDYVFVRIFPRRSEEGSFVSVYSLNRALCIKKIRLPGVDFTCILDTAVYLNGFLHWLADTAEKRVIVTFDITEKVIGEVEVSLPNVPKEQLSSSFTTIGTLGGQLCIFCEAQKVSELWVMKSYGDTDSWSRLYSIDHDELDSIGLLYIFKTGEIIMNSVMVMVEYDPKRKPVRETKIQGIQHGHTLHGLVAHVPSLVSLNSGTYLDPAN